jgi:FMN-dependent NADH-azoreductase
MKKILVLNGSIKKSNSNTGKLLAAFVNELKKVEGDIRVDLVNLSTHEWGKFWDVNEKGAFDNVDAATQTLSYDLIVIGSPMYNFSFSSVLKNYLDHICIPRLTFQYKYTTKRVEGLFKNKFVILGTRGGFYTDTKKAIEQKIPLMQSYDTNVISYLMTEYLSIKKVDELVVEGMNVKDDAGVPLNTIESWIDKNQVTLSDLAEKCLK